MPDGSGALPAITEHWRSLGLNVSTEHFDTGGDAVQVSRDGLATWTAKASDRGVALPGSVRRRGDDPSPELNDVRGRRRRGSSTSGLWAARHGL